MDFAERAARNEEVFRGVNEQIEDGAKQHAVSGPLPFHCESDNASCLDTIKIPPTRYAAIVGEQVQLVVVPGHEDPRMEQDALIPEAEFLVVSKISEARRRMDHDRPQRQRPPPDAGGAPVQFFLTSPHGATGRRIGTAAGSVR